MGTEALWLVWILTVVLVGLGIGAGALNGITEIATGGPGFLPFDRWLRKRRPATRDDFVLHGAAQVAQALGLTFIAAPTSFMSLLSTTDLATGWRPPSPPLVPAFVGLAVFGLYGMSLLLGFFFVVYGYSISTKVKYVAAGADARTAS